jgi:hypothetical protein
MSFEHISAVPCAVDKNGKLSYNMHGISRIRWECTSCDTSSLDDDSIRGKTEVERFARSLA